MEKIKTPKTKGVVRTPLIMQLEVLECGAASLAMVMAYYNKWVPLEQVREDISVSRDGANAKNILLAARKYGFKAKGYALTTKRLKEIGHFPCIIHWNRAHFVVLNGFTKKKAIINDPAKGIVKIDMKTFEQCFTGIYLELTPSEDFVPSGKRKSMLGFAKRRLVGAGALLAFFIITSIVFYVIGVLWPIMRERYIDNILDKGDNDWLLTFILIYAIIGIVEIVATIIKSVFTYKVKGKLAIEGNSSFMWKILKLPIAFFSQRMVGDLQQRKNANANIASTLINVFAPILLNSAILVVYLVLMIKRSLIITLVGVICVVINIIVSQLLVKQRISIAQVHARDNAMLNAMTSKGIEMIETIKSSGAENSYFHEWSNYKEAVTNNKKKMVIVNSIYGTIPSIISLIINFSVLFIGVYLTIQGEFTIGMVVGFQGLIGAFMTPASSIIESGQAIQEMRTEMERVDDVMECENDKNVDNELEELSYEKVKAIIEIKDITFGYNKLDKPLIENFSLTINEREKIAIVGGSGCGKSTLAKLISGLYEPWSGEILFDGKKISEIDRDTFTSSVSVVDQDIILFEDTIENNIKMWDGTIADFEMILASNDAQIHDAIMARPGQYKHGLLEGGKNLSGGERQRVEIARALARDPSILILDEATSALDAKTEFEIIQAIEKRGVTCIVVAHRLSSIRNANKIIVLDHGKVVEIGNHEELMEKQGYYYNLITNE